MNALRKHRAVLTALFVALIWVSIWLWMLSDEQPLETPATAMEAPVAQADNPAETASADASSEIVEPTVELSTRAVVERHKQVDREHLRQLHTGLFEYKKKHGHFPEYLSQLVPEFLSAEALDSPRNDKDGANHNLADHPDPGKARPGYGYEFSNLVFRDGRTFAEIKETQRAEWGDAVPILRAFGYGKVINMSYGGDLYETDLNWEWDPATLDVAKARGWGPGLSEGEFSQVRVLGADGRPVANAQVWADGRHYSFDLPNRPFTTDANGVANIPLGTDLKRTALVLRVEGSGLASQAVAFPLGQPPQNLDLTAEPAQTVGGRVTNADGSPIADTWIYLKGAGNADAAGLAGAGVNLGAVKTDPFGQWTASLHPADAAAFNIAVGGGQMPAKFSPGEPVDAAAAATRNAVSVFHTKPNPAGAAGADGQ